MEEVSEDKPRVKVERRAAKDPEKSKTIWFNLIVAVLGLAELYVDVLPPEYQGLAVAIIGFINIFLRQRTSGPVKGLSSIFKGFSGNKG